MSDGNRKLGDPTVHPLERTDVISAPPAPATPFKAPDAARPTPQRTQELPAPTFPLVQPLPPSGQRPAAAPRPAAHPLSSTAVIDPDEVRKARERLRISEARGIQLGMARLSAPEEAPTSTRAPFQITAPKTESERKSIAPPALTPWQEAQQRAVPLVHPLSQTAVTDLSEAPRVGAAPLPPLVAPTFGSPPSPVDKPADKQEDLPEPTLAAPKPPPSAPRLTAEEAFGRNLPAEPAPEPSPPPPKPEPIHIAERKEVATGLYGKFGKKGK